MTPEATYSALHLIDRWRQMLLTLAGERPPPLPAIRGRRCHGVHDDREQHERELLAARVWRELEDEGNAPD